jgi:hypothetical protein
MKILARCIAGLMVAMCTFGVVGNAALGSALPIRNGGYVLGPGTPNVVVEFVVGGHGTRVAEDGITCDPNASLIAQGVTQGAQQVVPIPNPLPGRISAGGNIAYSASLTLTPDDTQSSVSVTSRVVLNIHFLRLSKIVVRKTLAATGTVWVPSVCPGTAPTHFRLFWDPSASL